MFLSFRFGRAKVFAGLFVVFLLMVSSGHSVSASSGSGAPVTSSNFQPETGTITVLKRFCEADNSPNQNSNCNGRVEDAEGTIVTFDVRAGADVTAGAVTEQIGVLIAQQGNGSQGSNTGGALAAGSTFTVCEVPVAGYTIVPRPGAQGGQNQTLVPGAPCITVVLVPGNNVLQYNNFVAAAPTEEATETVEPTEPCEVDCGSPVVETPVIPEPTEPVKLLPSTGVGNDSNGALEVVSMLGISMLALMMVALAFRRKDTSSN